MESQLEKDEISKIDLYLKHKGSYPKNSKIFLAMTIDLIVFHLVVFALLKVITGFAHSFLDRYSVGRLGFFLYCLFLLAIPLLSCKAQTLGQFLTKIKIRSVYGGKIPFTRSVGRWFMSIFSLVGYGQRPVPWYDYKNDAILLNARQDSKLS